MFIVLHFINDEEIRININCIESYGTITEERFDGLIDDLLGCTYINYIGMKEDEYPYIVKEKPEEIDAMIDNLLEEYGR